MRNAKVLADEFFAEFRIEDLVNLPAGHFCMIDGMVSRGFGAVTLKEHVASRRPR